MLKILALSDFSANAQYALSVAMRLAQHLNGTVVFVHVMTKSPVPATAPESLFSDLQIAELAKCQEVLREEVQQLYQKLHIRHKEVMYQLKVVSTPFVESVVQVSEGENIDLLIMGSTGSSGIKQIILGNHTLKMIRKTTRPLLVIPSEYIFNGFLNITLIIRPERFKYTGSLNILLRIARHYSAMLHFLFLIEADEDKPEISKFLAQHNIWQAFKEHISYNYKIQGAGQPEDLLQHLDQNNTDLLVFFPRSKSLWQELFSSSITEEIAHYGKKPVMVFPIPEQ